MSNISEIPVLLTPKPSVCGSGAVRLVPVDGDNMMPTLNEGDAVGAIPVNGFSCDGIYVVEFFGAVHVVRCSSNFRGGIILSNDNKAYPPQTIAHEQFDEIVMGQVAMLCNVINKSLFVN